MLPTVRPAVAGDVPGILPLLAALAAERNRPAPALDEEGLREMAFGPRPSFRILVISSGGRVVAASIVYPGFDPVAGTRGMHVASVYVMPEQRRHGMGRALAASAARLCREEGGTWLTWGVEGGDEGSWTFCEHTGASPLRLLTPMRLEGDAFDDLAESA